MRIPARNSLLASAIALTLLGATVGVIAAPVVSQEVTDARQQSQIWTTFALNPNLRANDLGVSVQNGAATLTGKVDEEVSKELAKQIALGVEGVTRVDNQIVVQPDYVPAGAAAERGYGETVEDATITAAVKSKLLWSKYASGTATDVDTRRGAVTLTGTAASAQSRELAGRLAANTRGVRSVTNRLVVSAAPVGAAATVRSTAEQAEHAVADGWITTKVKSTFVYSTQVDGSDITVRTDAGVVTLSGSVDSAAERALAVELAQNVRGVKSVQSAGLTL